MAKTKAKKNTLLRVSVILFLLYVVISLVQIQGSIQKNREQLAALEQQNEEQRIANKELERILSDGTEEEYIERLPGTAGFAYRKNRCWWIFPAVDSKDYRRMQTECSSWLWGIL